MAAGTTEDLLHDWLAELLFEAESRRVMYDQFRFTRIGPASLVCELGGRTIDFQRSQATEEIKAVTYHRLRVEQLPGGGWEATVIFDV
jgi:SHS2 domain-containing protein